MEIDKKRNKIIENDSRNVSHIDNYYSTFSNYNKFINKKVIKKEDKGTSTIDINLNSISSNINLMKLTKLNENNKIKKINTMLYDERTKYKIL